MLKYQWCPVTEELPLYLLLLSCYPFSPNSSKLCFLNQGLQNKTVQTVDTVTMQQLRLLSIFYFLPSLPVIINNFAIADDDNDHLISTDGIHSSGSINI